MAAVMVRPGSVGFVVNCAPPEAPAARAATMVSPMARDVATMKAATMPETAAGTTTRRTVVDFLAPTP